MSEPPSKITKPERALLRQLAQKAWEAELEIHEFHNGASRELYGRYASLDPAVTVARAIALADLLFVGMILEG